MIHAVETAAPPAYAFADVDLARRLEGTEAVANAAFVEARAALQPESGACWIEVAGACAMFDGVDSPLTQTFGLGLAGSVHDDELAALEAFFTDRGAEVFHEVSPLADPALPGQLAGRGFRPFEFTSVLHRPIAAGWLPAAPPGTHVTVRRIDAAEADAWALVAAEGWSETPGLAGFMLELGRISARSRGNHAFLAELDGRPIGAGSLVIAGSVALLAGASTVPSARRLGAQAALLETRLRFAVENGCTLAMIGAAPGSGSQRNAERQGFRIAYTRMKWRRGE
jgi:GNAT superfamily N-acetyltransferase